MRENKNLELKSELTNTFLKTVSAFANFGKGEIKFGIADDGTVTGVKNPDQLCLDIENKINDNISPKPDFTFSVNRRKHVITLTVFEGSYKPYLYKGKAYRRNDTSTVEVDRIELNRLTLEGSNQYFEQLRNDDQNLQFTLLQEKFSEILGIELITPDILKTLNLFSDAAGYNKAAALLADKNSFAGMDIVRFGNNIDEILDRETYEQVSIIKQYAGSVEMYKKYYQYEKITGIERKLLEIVPEKAFREAVSNALIHRTWDVSAHIRIAMHPDRIEIMSPGGLPFGLKEEEYLRGQISMFRNPIIGSVFFRLHYIEMFGTGVKRINEAYSSFAMKPIFEIFENSIKVTLPTTNTKPLLTIDEEVIYQALSAGKQLSSSEISAFTEFGKNKTIRLLNSLVEKKYIRMQGKGRGTKYYT